MKVRTNTCFDKDPRVEMVSLVGSGGNGQCFLLKIEDQYRILKKFFPYSIDSMNNEIFALEKHKNPFMPILYDKSTNHPTEKNSWILTDYIPGPNLFEIMHSGYEGYRLKRLVMLKILKGITLQLTMMNKSNLKHRDLKPENILIDAHLIPHIIDHGNSSTENNNSERKSSGTIPYTAPEVLKNNNSSKSDIYSLGGIIFRRLLSHSVILKEFFETHSFVMKDISNDRRMLQNTYGKSMKCNINDISVTVTSSLQFWRKFRRNGNNVQRQKTKCKIQRQESHYVEIG